MILEGRKTWIKFLRKLKLFDCISQTDLNKKTLMLTSTCAIKHKDTVRKSLFLLTEFTLYYCSLKITKYNILTFTLHTCSPWNADFASDLLPFISLWEATQIWWLWRSYEYQTKFWEFPYVEILAHAFQQFCVYDKFVYEFVRIPWPDVHMDNLKECFYHVLTNFILLHKNTRLLKKCK